MAATDKDHGITIRAVPGTSLTMDEQKALYFAWKRNGSPHNPLCYACRQPGGTVNCVTCLRSYHGDCLPQLSQGGKETFYCEPCRMRGWHEQPPTLDGEASDGSRQRAVRPIKASVSGAADDGTASWSSPAPHQQASYGDVARSLRDMRRRVMALEEDERGSGLTEPSPPK